MDEELKKRLIGAAVLISLAVIFLPMLIEHEPIQLERAHMQSIPPEPKRKFNQSLLPEKPVDSGVETKESPAPQPPVEKTNAEKDPGPKTNETGQPAGAEKAAESKPASKQTPAEKVQAAKTPASKPPPSGWVIQAGSFSSRENAEALVLKLRKAGLDTMNVQPIKVDGKSLYRVRVGPEIDRKNAEKLVPRVAKISGAPAKVLKYP